LAKTVAKKVQPVVKNVKTIDEYIGKYFWVVIALFAAQVLLGIVTAHYQVEGQGLYGLPFTETLPYAVTRTWHTQLAVLWIATAWLGTGLYIAPAMSGHEPRGQRFFVNALFACLLVIGRRGHYDALHSILVYPSAFWVEDEVEDEAGVVEKRRRDLSGEAWEASRIILSWEDVMESARFPAEGYNVALHEFAHYLDAEGMGLAAAPMRSQGATDPAPSRVRALGTWSADVVREFEALQEAVDRDEETFLDPYAAEDATEFFAVATEDFFERPCELRQEHPRLYALMQEFYGLDPAAW